MIVWYLLNYLLELGKVREVNLDHVGLVDIYLISSGLSTLLPQTWQSSRLVVNSHNVAIIDTQSRSSC